MVSGVACAKLCYSMWSAYVLLWEVRVHRGDG